MLRSLLNIPNRVQAEKIKQQVVLIENILAEQEHSLFESKYRHAEENKTRNKICKKCGSKKVINKILNKTRSVTDGFYPFLGIRDSHIESYHYEINHCSDCENEWEQYNYYDDNSREKRTYLTMFHEALLNRKKFENTFKWKIDPYKEFYAESMYKVFGKKCKISLYEFRKILKSVYDKK